MLEDFDRDRDGRIDGEEKESAFTNENFVVSQLTQIDTNQDGWLEASELMFFDANKNKVLDPNEQAGIEHALNLLAVRLVRSFDSDGNGLLSRREVDELLRASPAGGIGSMTIAGGVSSDDNHDGSIDVVELQEFCRFQVSRGFQDRPPGMPPFGGPMFSGRVTGDAKQRFKEQVDNFWQNGGTNAAWQTRRPGFPHPTRPPPVQPK